MWGRIIVQQAPDLGHVQIQPHVRNPFQQLVEHMFVEVHVHCLPQRNKLSMDHAAQIKKHDQHRLHARLLPSQFLWSRRPLAHPFCTLSFSGWVVHKTPQFVPRHNCGQKCWVAVMRHEKVFARSHTVYFLFRRKHRQHEASADFFLPKSSVMMWRIISRLMGSYSSSRWTIDRQLCCSTARTAAMLLSVQLVLGRLTHSLLCMSSQPSRNLPNHRNVVVCDTHSSPYAFRSNSYVSVPVLPAFQQNFITLRCSIFVSMTIVVNTLRANCYNFTVTAPTLLVFFPRLLGIPLLFSSSRPQVVPRILPHKNQSWNFLVKLCSCKRGNLASRTLVKRI